MAVDITFPRDGLLSCAYDTAMPIDDLNPDYEEKLGIGMTDADKFVHSYWESDDDDDSFGASYSYDFDDDWLVPTAAPSPSSPAPVGADGHRDEHAVGAPGHRRHRRAVGRAVGRGHRRADGRGHRRAGGHGHRRPVASRRPASFDFGDDDHFGMGSYSFSYVWEDDDDTWGKPTAKPMAKPALRADVLADASAGVLAGASADVKPSSRPSAKPSPAPSPAPTPAPSALDFGDDDHFGMGSYSFSYVWEERRPWGKPTAKPVAKPTLAPTSSPMPAPTSSPTPAPTPEPSAKPPRAPFSFSYSYVYGGGDDDWTGTTCACSAFYNGADAEDEFLCVKKSNGVPPAGGDGACPGDHDGVQQAQG
ncbi:hypothetical protein JL720_15969 [Aureococcus anophagefferens]|nr:hypothetical protein JL720_15969 [Aureococcus anophagefferens]